MSTNFSNAGCNTAMTTAANVQSLAGRFESLLTAAGWVQTADTGQTAAASFPAASGTSQVLGYQIWHMGDALEATAPIFMKWELVSGLTQTAYPALAITIGTGSDGSGNITQGANTLLARTVFGGSVTNSAAWYFLASADTNRFCLYMGTPSGSFTFAIERNKDSAGVDTADGVYLFGNSVTAVANTSLTLFKLVRPTGTTPPNSTTPGAFVPSGATWARDNNVGVCPFRYFDGQPTYPGLGGLVYVAADTAALNPVTTTLYGASHTYMPIGATLLTNYGLSSNASLMLRYE